MNERSSLRAWLELLRVPNLFTVPGDPLAGFLLAWTQRTQADLALAIPCAAASLLIYAGGLVSNDLFDFAEDLRDRPHRPLPSGHVSKRAAILAAIALFALGVASAALAGLPAACVAGVLAGLVVAYNAFGKRVAIWGPINMGLCRGSSLLLGAAALGPEALLSRGAAAAAVGLTCYVAAVTFIASKETSGREVGWAALGPCAVLLLWLPTVSALGPAGGTPFGAIARWLGLFTAILLGMSGINLRRQSDPRNVARGVGSFIRALLPVQAVLALSGAEPGFYVAAALLILWPMSILAGRWFYSS